MKKVSELHEPLPCHPYTPCADFIMSRGSSHFPTTTSTHHTGQAHSNANPHHNQSLSQQSSVIMKNEVFVGNLSYFCDESDLYNLFNSYADVTYCRVMRNANNIDRQNRSLLFGFVTLSSVHEAKEMSKLLTGMLFMGRLLRYVLLFPF